MNINDVLQHGFASIPQLSRARSVTGPREQPAGPSQVPPSGEAPTAQPVDRAEISSEAKRAASELTPEEQAEVDELVKRDREVRVHEQAHKAAGGQYSGSISYQYTTGPDGRRYVSGGSVPIDTSPVPDDPDATIRKMQQVAKAALAPAEPSAADRNVASTAQRRMTEARAEKVQLEQEERMTQAEESDSLGSPPTPVHGYTARGEGEAPFASSGGRVDVVA